MIKARKNRNRKIIKSGSSKDSGSDGLLQEEDKNARSETEKHDELNKKEQATTAQKASSEEAEGDDWEKNKLEIQVDIEIADQW